MIHKNYYFKHYVPFDTKLNEKDETYPVYSSYCSMMHALDLLMVTEEKFGTKLFTMPVQSVPRLFIAITIHTCCVPCWISQ